MTPKELDTELKEIAERCDRLRLTRSEIADLPDPSVERAYEITLNDLLADIPCNLM